MRAMRALHWFIGWALLLAFLAVPSARARAQDYPTRPIRIIVGPSPDIFSRIIAEHLQDA